jgi:hypothetical protein
MHEDVFMRTFCQSLQGDARIWFKNLEADSIGSWVDFHDVFLRYWGERKSYDQYLSEFYAMKRKKDETVTSLIGDFKDFISVCLKTFNLLKLLPCCITQQPIILT